MALSIIFTIVFAVVAIVLMYLAVLDCMDMYEAVRGLMVLKPAAATSVAEHCPNAVLEQV